MSAPALARPGLFTIGGLASGQAFGLGFLSSNPTAGWVVATCASVLFLAVGPRRTLAPWLLFLAFAGIGFAQQERFQRADRLARSVVESTVGENSILAQIQGTLAESPRVAGSRIYLTMARNSLLGCAGREAIIPAPIVVVVPASTIFPREDLPQIGDSVEAIGPLEMLPPWTADGEPDARLAARGAVAVVQGRMVDVKPPLSGRSLWPRFQRSASLVSEDTLILIQQNLPASEAALLQALLLGKASELTPERRTAYRRTGLIHLFSVSGLHTTIIGGLIAWMLALMGLGPLLRLLVLAAALAFFAAMVGMNTPVIRAAIMLLLFEGRHLLQRGSEPVAVLGTIATGFVLWAPETLWQLDFQLSFLCLFALAVASPWVEQIEQTDWMGNLNVIPAFLARTATQIIVASIAIQLLIAPIQLARFGEVSLIAPVANLLILPIADIVLKIAVLAIMLAPAIPPVSSGTLTILELPLHAIGQIAEFLASLPFAAMGGKLWPQWLSGVFFLVILCGPWMRRSKDSHPARFPTWWLAHATIVLLLLLGGPLLPRRPAQQLDVHFLDVGQGDAILLHLPDGQAGLIDAGPEGAGFWLPSMLRARGISELEFAIATHADSDHIGGFADLLRAVPVRHFFIGGGLTGSELTDEINQELLARNLTPTPLRRGDALEFTGGRLAILHPTDSFLSAEEIGRNDSSIVARLEVHGRSILLTGDAERAAEADILAANLLEPADVLKAGHHGARDSTSDALLQAVKPDLVVFSVGRNNRFNHPAPETIARIMPTGAAIARTDRQGSVLVSISRSGVIRWSTAREND